MMKLHDYRSFYDGAVTYITEYVPIYGYPPVIRQPEGHAPIPEEAVRMVRGKHGVAGSITVLHTPPHEDPCEVDL